MAPSVVTIDDIADNTSDSFSRSKIHVTVKNKIVEPSHTLYYAAESIKIRGIKSDDCVDIRKPILFMFTDSGPDHRVIFDTARQPSLVLFIDFDMLVAERSMSVPNLSLQHIEIARERMADMHEHTMKSKSFLSAIRN